MLKIRLPAPTVLSEFFGLWAPEITGSFFTGRSISLIGSLLGGAVAYRLGAPETLLIGGICCLAGALLFLGKLSAIREIIRPIYIEKRIISEAVLGLQAATQWPKAPPG